MTNCSVSNRYVRQSLACYDPQLWRSEGFLPEVGDLHLSSEVLGPSLESQSAAEATKMQITFGINHFKLEELMLGQVLHPVRREQ